MGFSFVEERKGVLKQKFKWYKSAVQKDNPIKVKGKINKMVGLGLESSGPSVSLGDLCFVERRNDSTVLQAEVVGLRDDSVLLMPLGDVSGVTCGDLVNPAGIPFQVPVGNGLLGRIINGIGKPIDGKGEIEYTEKYPVHNNPPCPMTRRKVTTHIGSGIRAIDGFASIGKGQRMGIFAGSGVGKSILLGMISKYSDAQVNVIALIGERGRELRDFVDKSLGPEGLKKSVVIVATSDQPALVRVKGALVAHAIAEYFRDQGLDVMFMMDSVTRFAMAQREVGLSVGEPPTSKGYTPSVFSMLSALLERSGGGSEGTGTITGLYTVLVESDDFNEPISDAVRAILDGHIMLTRDLAIKNHYPAINVLDSVSRVFTDVAPPEHIQAAGKMKEILATYEKAEDLINIGAYVAGSNPKIDLSIRMIDKIKDYLRQNYNESTLFSDNQNGLINLYKEV